MPDLIRNIAEIPWQRMPAHDEGALSKLLVHPETTGSRHLDYRISTYAPGAGVDRHAHRVQEQVYHVLEGEGLMEVDDITRVVRRHDVIQLPAGVPHRILNTGIGDLVFIVVTAPGSDELPA